MLLVRHEHRRLQRGLERLLGVADDADDFDERRAVGSLGGSRRGAELRAGADRARDRAAEKARSRRFR